MSFNVIRKNYRIYSIWTLQLCNFIINIDYFVWIILSEVVLYILVDIFKSYPYTFLG